MIESLWLTVNRNCNLRCSWCYAEGAKYKPEDDMKVDVAHNLFLLGKDVGAKNVVILGGEPTMWASLPELIRRINIAAPDIVPVIVTNGVLFAYDAFIKRFDGLNYKVGLSLKAASEKQYRELTGFGCLDKVSNAISILTKKDKLYGVSVTINSLVVDDLTEMARVVSSNGGNAISFEMCAPSFDCDGNPDGRYLVHPKTMADKIVASYYEINQLMRGNAFYQLSIPFCLFPNGFIHELMDAGKIISGCHVFNRDGLIFDSTGRVLLCNCLYHAPIGKYGEDFFNADSLATWWNKKEVIEVNEKLLNYPSMECIDCKYYRYCGGGCSLSWFYFNPSKTIKGVGYEND